MGMIIERKPLRGMRMWVVIRFGYWTITPTGYANVGCKVSEERPERPKADSLRQRRRSWGHKKSPRKGKSHHRCNAFALPGRGVTCSLSPGRCPGLCALRPFRPYVGLLRIITKKKLIYKHLYYSWEEKIVKKISFYLAVFCDFCT